MEYLSLPITDVSMHQYPDNLKPISITIRGTTNFFDMFFSLEDVETSFQITLPPRLDFTWIVVENNAREKYLTYVTLKKCFTRSKNVINWLFHI